MLAIESNLWETRACVSLIIRTIIRTIIRSEGERGLLLKCNLVGEVVDILKRNFIYGLLAVSQPEIFR